MFHYKFREENKRTVSEIKERQDKENKNSIRSAYENSPEQRKSIKEEKKKDETVYRV